MLYANSLLRHGINNVANKIKPEFIPVYPVANSLDDAWEHMRSQLPIDSINDLKSLVSQYHNSLIVAIQEAENSDETDSAS